MPISSAGEALPRRGPGTVEERPLLRKKPQKTRFNRIDLFDQAVSAGNGTSLALIYGLRQFAPLIFFEVGRFVLAPFNAAANLIRSVIALHQARKGGYSKPLVIRAVIAVVTGLGVAIALIGGLIAGAAFAIAGPALAVASFGVRAIYNAINAVYYGLHYYATKDLKSRTIAITNAIHAVAATLNAIGIGLVMLAFQASMGVIGIISGAITAVISVYHLAKIKAAAAVPPKGEDSKKPLKKTLSTTAASSVALSRLVSPSPSEVSKKPAPLRPPVSVLDWRFTPPAAQRKQQERAEGTKLLHKH